MIIDLIDTQWYTITIRREYKKEPLEAEKKQNNNLFGQMPDDPPDFIRCRRRWH